MNRESAFGDGSGLSSFSGSVFAPAMGLVAATLGFFTLGAYLGRHLGEGSSWLFFILGFCCLVALNFARESGSGALGLLAAVGLFLGLGIGGVIDVYAEAAPGAVWQAGAATALFVAGFGAAGYLTTADLSGGYRVLFVLLLGLIIYGLVSLFTGMSQGNVVYALLGLAIFGGYTLLDFNRMRRRGMDEPVSIAAGVFVDIINVFQFFLQLFVGREARG